jgi:hypothetical protein
VIISANKLGLMSRNQQKIGNRMIFFRRFDQFDRLDALSAVPTYDWRNVPERSLACANDDMICVITQSKTITYQLNSLLFILGQGRIEDCNSWDGMLTIILICA